MRFGMTCVHRLAASGAALLLAACAAAPVRIAEPPPARNAESTEAPAEAVEEPLPAHWLGVFTMVETPTGTAGRGQFQLRLGQQGPNHFYARRGCYIRDGWLKRRGGEWLVEPSGAVRADEQCLADPNAFKGFAEGLFEHRAIMLSPPGERHWIAEGGARWTYLPNPAAAPLQPPAPREPSPRQPHFQAPLDVAKAASDLFGEWQVTSLETPLLSPQERRIGDPGRIALLIGVRGIEASSQCVPFLFEHGRNGERIRITEQGWPEPVCARGLTPYERVFGAVLAGASRIEQTGSGEFRLSGAAGSVTLQRPAGGMVANPFGNQPAPGGELLWGHYRVAEIGGVAPPPDVPIDVALGRIWIEARSGCLPFRWRWIRAGSGWEVREDWPDPRCEQGHSEAEQALEQTMRAVRRLDWVAPYRLRLSGPAGSVTLVRVRAGGAE